ncbi:unnamed protein product, partial [marine sediment metagenome]
DYLKSVKNNFLTYWLPGGEIRTTNNVLIY